MNPGSYLKRPINIILVSFMLLTIFLLGRNLSPISKTMFTFHDETQAARVQQFTLNLQNLQIPPRMAPEFSYGMGYPVFNFYAPFAYWVTSGLNLLGLSIISSLKLSFLIAIIVGFLGMFMLLKELFDETAGLIGGILYITSIFIPVEIFVRGNLSETWFMGLFPVALFFLIKNANEASKKVFIGTVVTLSFLFTVHNIMSLISVALILIFIMLLDNKKRNMLAIMQALLLSSYFLVPALLESGLTYASVIATKTSVNDHFLCIKQLWNSSVPGGWGFGGSVPGCIADGMSFALGKPLFFFGLLAGVVLFIKLTSAKSLYSLGHSTKITLFIAFLTFLSLFLTLYQSQFIWNIFAPILSLFQFPWRFLVFGVFGLAFLGGYLVFEMYKKITESQMQTIYKLAIYCVCVVLMFIASKYFSGQTLSNTLYESQFLSNEYIHEKVAYKIPEYLPKTAKYDMWRSFEDKNAVPYSEGLFSKNSLNFHYFPYWNITVNGARIVPTRFDSLGRPVIATKGEDVVLAVYQQTPIEQVGNIMTILAGISLIGLLYKPLWMKIQKIKN